MYFINLYKVCRSGHKRKNIIIWISRLLLKIEVWFFVKIPLFVNFLFLNMFLIISNSFATCGCCHPCFRKQKSNKNIAKIEISYRIQTAAAAAWEVPAANHRTPATRTRGAGDNSWRVSCPLPPLTWTTFLRRRLAAVKLILPPLLLIQVQCRKDGFLERNGWID